TLIKRERNIGVQIELIVERRASQFASSSNRNLTSIEVNRMRQKLADRYARFRVESQTEIQPCPESPVEAGALAAESVARIDVRYEAPVSIQRSDLELIAEQVEVA